MAIQRVFRVTSLLFVVGVLIAIAQPTPVLSSSSAVIQQDGPCPIVLPMGVLSAPEHTITFEEHRYVDITVQEYVPIRYVQSPNLPPQKNIPSQGGIPIAPASGPRYIPSLGKFVTDSLLFSWLHDAQWPINHNTIQMYPPDEQKVPAHHWHAMFRTQFLNDYSDLKTLLETNPGAMLALKCSFPDPEVVPV